MSAITLQDMSYSYRGKFQAVNAVQSVNASFEYGKLYAIVGKSGSGKSTLLSMIAGLDTPREGDVLCDGQSLRSLDISEYRVNRVSLIYQSFNLFPLLTVLENTMLPLHIRKVPKTEAQDLAVSALESVGLLKPYHTRFPSMLSGGEHQRAAIARTLASGSNIILADEPTGNLDNENSVTIISILKTLAQEHNRCVIVVTHDNAVSERADIVLSMQDGRMNTSQS